MTKNIKDLISSPVLMPFFVSAIMLVFGGTASIAKEPEAASKAKPDSSKTTKNERAKLKTPEEPKPKSAEEDSSSISSFTAEYAVYMKKAAAAIGIKRPLRMKEERLLWADYKSGKYAKNKEFTQNMQKAEPYHKKLRSILHIFEGQEFKKLDFSQPAPAKIK